MNHSVHSSARTPLLSSRHGESNPSDNKFDDTELSSEALGGSIQSVSDEFFAAASCLLKVPVSCKNSTSPRVVRLLTSRVLVKRRKQPSVSMKGQFGPNGALFDGWESRRHNQSYDW